MSSTLALQPAPRAGQQAPGNAEDAQYYRAVLHELIGMGADLARSIHQQATASPAAKIPDRKAPAPDSIGVSAPTPDLTVAFDRIARCVRRSIALAHALAEPSRQATRPAQHRTAARKRIIRAVEDVIHRKADASRAEALGAELSERLDSPDLDDDLDRPVADIIAEICRDLGLDDTPGVHPRKRRTPADVATLHARAAAPCNAQPCNAQPSAGPRPAQPPAAAPAPAAHPAPASAQPGLSLPSDPAKAVAHVLHYAPLFRRE